MSKKAKMCVYCGVREATEAEHVLPRLLFPKPRPKVMIKVPACGECNDDKKEDDEYLRDFMVIDIENAGHPIADGLLKEKMLRAAQRNQSRLAKDVIRKSVLAPVHSQGGIYLGHRPAVPLDHERANRIFTRITRGLYYQLYHRRLPDDCTFEVRRVLAAHRADHVQRMVDMGVNVKRVIGDTFDCWHVVGQEDDTVSMWLMRFFNIFITVTTNLDKHPAPQTEPRQLESWLT
jgi:hypothetical protein